MILTERLRLRPFEAGDMPAFVGYGSHPDVARYAMLRQEWEDRA